MKRTVLSIFLIVFCMSLVFPVYAQERRPQRRSSVEEQRRARTTPEASARRAVPRPPQQQRPYQRNYRSSRREPEWGFYFHYDFPRYGYSRPYYDYYDRQYYPRYYQRYYSRCVPDRRVFVGYDWYGYPVYDFIPGYCY